MPYADKEKYNNYLNEYRRRKRRERGLQKVGRKPVSEEVKKATLKRVQLNYKITHRVELNARQWVKRAVKDGRLIRMPCVICSTFPSEGHHPDYTKPLDVIWLCPQHHREEHERISARL